MSSLFLTGLNEHMWIEIPSIFRLLYNMQPVSFSDVLGNIIMKIQCVNPFKQEQRREVVSANLRPKPASYAETTTTSAYISQLANVSQLPFLWSSKGQLASQQRERCTRKYVLVGHSGIVYRQPTNVTFAMTPANEM